MTFTFSGSPLSEERMSPPFSVDLPTTPVDQTVEFVDQFDPMVRFADEVRG
jgi:hypothetical protein